MSSWQWRPLWTPAANINRRITAAVFEIGKCGQKCNIVWSLWQNIAIKILVKETDPSITFKELQLTVLISKRSISPSNNNQTPVHTIHLNQFAEIHSHAHSGYKSRSSHFIIHIHPSIMHSYWLSQTQVTGFHDDTTMCRQCLDYHTTKSCFLLLSLAVLLSPGLTLSPKCQKRKRVVSMFPSKKTLSDVCESVCVPRPVGLVFYV